MIVLTSGSRPGDMARCKELRIDAHLMKPIKQSELFDAIAMSLGITTPEDHGVAAPAESRRLPSLRVLLAEDSLVNQKLAIALLGKHGHTVTVAGTGKEAVHLWESGDFDVVLMDVQMPEMDGMEATAVIRAQEARTGRRVPIIAMTAHAMKGDRELCLAAGMDDYVAKPIRAQQLFDTLERVLSKVQKTRGTAQCAEQSIDFSTALEAVEGDRQMLQEIVQVFLDECPKMLAHVVEALQRGDASLLQRAAHTLKAALQTVGATTAAALAQQLESMGQRQDLTNAERRFTELEGAIRDVRTVLLDERK